MLKLSCIGLGWWRKAVAGSPPLAGVAVFEADVFVTGVFE